MSQGQGPSSSFPWWGAESGMGLQGDDEVERWGVNIYIDGGAARGVTREDRRDPELELEAPQDGLGVPPSCGRS